MAVIKEFGDLWKLEALYDTKEAAEKALAKLAKPEKKNNKYVEIEE